MLRKIAIVLILVFLSQFYINPPASALVQFRDLQAQAAILAEKDSGTVLFEYNTHERHPADALSKIMTLLLASYAVENDVINDNELIEMTETAWLDIDEDMPTQDILPGEEMTFIDLMYSAFLGNASEACNMLALRIAGSVEAFVRMMNEKAVELGCTSTQFVNPHGLYNENQYTTAHDMLTLYTEAMKCVLFMEVASTFRHVTEGTEEFEARTLTSSNALLNQSSVYYYRFCTSGINSGTYEGAYSLVASAEEEGMTLISVILGAEITVFDDESTDMRNFSETQRLFLWGYSQFEWREILKTTDLLKKVPVLHGAGGDFVNARPVEGLTLLLDKSIPNEAFEKVITIYSIENDEPLVAPVSAGDILGEVVVMRDGVEYARMKLVANTNIDLNGFEYIRRQIVEMLTTATARYVIITLIALVLLYVALVVRYNIVRANRLRRIKNAKSDIIRQRHQNFRE